MLNETDQNRIGRLISTMSKYSLNRPFLYNAILSELTGMCETMGHCSILRISGLDEGKIRIFGKPSHFNENANPALLPMWCKYIKGNNNPILRGLLHEYSQSHSSVDFASGAELLQAIKYYEDTTLRNALFNKLAARANVEGLGYLWLRLTSNFTWLICLRRKKEEGLFTEFQKQLLQQFGYLALGSQGCWYIPSFDVLDSLNNKLKDKLTDRQFETLHYLGCHCSRKKCAKLMGVSDATIDRNVETLLRTFREHFAEFEGKNIAHIIHVLKERAFLTTHCSDA